MTHRLTHRMRIAYQGAPGAFGHEACLAFAPGHEPVGEPSFERVVEAVVEGRADLGMLPVRNNEAGPVPGNEALIAGAPVRILGEHGLAIRIHLLALAGTRLEDIRTAVSHPVALKQCANSLARLGLAAEEAANTAFAARALADPTRAVLASEAAAVLYGLEILVRDMQDRPDNLTIFALFERG
jgi:prephenate dehydratase